MKYFTLNEIKKKRPYRKGRVFLIRLYMRFIQAIEKELK